MIIVRPRDLDDAKEVLLDWQINHDLPDDEVQNIYSLFIYLKENLEDYIQLKQLLAMNTMFQQKALNDINADENQEIGNE